MDNIKVSNKKRATEYIKRLVDGSMPKQMVEITYQEAEKRQEAVCYK